MAASFDEERVDASDVHGEDDAIFSLASSDFFVSSPVHSVGAWNLESIKKKHLLNE